MTNVLISPVPMTSVDLWLRLSLPYIAAGITTEPGMSIGQAVDGVVEGEFQPWVVVDGVGSVKGAFLTRVVEEPDGSVVLDVGSLGGCDLALWGKPLSARMADFAKSVGAEKVVFRGRKALARVYESVRIVAEESPGIFKYERVVA